MLSITTFIKTRNGFVNLTDWPGSPDDPNYIEGALQLSINGRELLNTTHYDYIDQLWSYIVHAILNLRQGKRFTTLFPDQPIEMIFSLHHNSNVNITVDVDGKKAVAFVDRLDLISTLEAAAQEFFHVMIEKVPSKASSYGHVISLLKE